MDSTIKKSDIPQIGIVQTAELGSNMLLQQDIEVIRGRKVSPIARGYQGPFPVDFFGMYVRVNNGEHYCGTIVNRDPLNYGKKQYLCFTDKEFQEKNITNKDAEDIVQKPTNFQRILEYSGKSTNTISLYYKEYNQTQNGAFIRPAFTQEFKFDLSESNVIGMKGARIEVIKANNTGIKYKIISHFNR
jgi:hypothetical protein